jgi:hypothetical protein
MSEIKLLPIPARDYTVTFADGTTEAFTGITRHDLHPAGVLRLYRRPRREGAEELVVSLSLAQMRMWVKAEASDDAVERLHICHGCTGQIAVADQRSMETSVGTEYWHNNCLSRET